MSTQRKSPVHLFENYDSDFEPNERITKKAKKDDDYVVTKYRPCSYEQQRATHEEEFKKEYRKVHRNQFLSLDAYSKHKELINHYILCYRGASSRLQRDRSRDKTDSDVIKENHRFLWDEDEKVDTWGKQLAKKYYDKLFKEYCLADLSLFMKKKIAMRWRTEKEVVSGKGQFSCGNIHCKVEDKLRSWEVNFAYVEKGVKKNALVKLRLCPDCSMKMNVCHKTKESTVSKKGSSSKVDSTSIDSSQKDEVPLDPEATSISRGAGSSADSESIEKSEGEASVWKEPLPVSREAEKSRDVEFEEYLADLLL